MRFLDSSIFIRHLAGDHPTRSAACQALFVAIERGGIVVWTTDQVIQEVIHVLTSPRLEYRQDRETVRDGLLPLIELPGIKLDNKRLYRRIFALYTSLPIDFVDAYHAIYIELRGADELFSYDTDFDRIAGIRRIEPPDASVVEYSRGDG
ncbi:MAG: PIN domain-containing protein [Thermomicrobiales bacterium]